MARVFAKGDLVHRFLIYKDPYSDGLWVCLDRLKNNLTYHQTHSDAMDETTKADTNAGFFRLWG